MSTLDTWPTCLLGALASLDQQADLDDESCTIMMTLMTIKGLKQQLVGVYQLFSVKISQQMTMTMMMMVMITIIIIINIQQVESGNWSEQKRLFAGHKLA